ncbi:MAG: flippase, partial [Bacteroidetes bacterium]|nr:flippase [Bacteroidota bacterium]
MEQRGASAKAISSNVTWLAIDRIIRMGVMLGMSVWMARYLGAAAFGQYAYALAFVQLFSVVAAFGLENVVIRDIVRDTAPARLETLGSAWRLQQ